MAENQITPLETAKGFTRAELRGVQRLASNIKLDLFEAPVTQQTTTWRRHQEIALAVVLERIKNGR